jgi:hypothetical protein
MLGIRHRYQKWHKFVSIVNDS